MTDLTEYRVDSWHGKQTLPLTDLQSLLPVHFSELDRPFASSSDLCAKLRWSNYYFMYHTL